MTTVVSTIVVVVASVLSTILNTLWRNRTVFAVVSTIVGSPLIHVSTASSLRFIHTPRVHSIGSWVPAVLAIFTR